MSTEWEEYKKAVARSDQVTNEVLLEQAKERLLRSNGESFVRHILSSDKSKKR